jgi:hypothetical protein
MRREGHAVTESLHRSGQWLDTVTYALLANEWPGRSSRLSRPRAVTRQPVPAESRLYRSKPMSSVTQAAHRRGRSHWLKRRRTDWLGMRI